MLTSYCLQKGANSQANKACLLKVGLARRTFSDVKRHRRCSPGNLRPEIVLLTSWQLACNPVNQINVIQGKLPYLKLLKLESHPRKPLSSIVHRPSSIVHRPSSI